MGSLSFTDLFQGSTIVELVCDSPHGHTSRFVPPNASCRRSVPISTRVKPSPPKSRWDSSSTCHNSPVKPQKSRLDSPLLLKHLRTPPTPYTFQHVPKSVCHMPMTADFDDVCQTADKHRTRANFLTNVLNNLTLIDDNEDDHTFDNILTPSPSRSVL